MVSEAAFNIRHGKHAPWNLQRAGIHTAGHGATTATLDVVVSAATRVVELAAQTHLARTHHAVSSARS